MPCNGNRGKKWHFFIVHEELLELLIYISLHTFFFFWFLGIRERANQLSMGFSVSKCGIFFINKLLYSSTLISWSMLDKLAEVFTGIG